MAKLTEMRRLNCDSDRICLGFPASKLTPSLAGDASFGGFRYYGI